MSRHSHPTIALLAMLIAWKIPFEDPKVILYTRIGYVSTQFVILTAYFVCISKIRQKNDLTVLRYLQLDLETLVTMRPVTNTVRDYDLVEVLKSLGGILFELIMMAFIHLYLKYTQPLFVDAIMDLLSLYDSKLIKVHILGQAAEGELKRPFKSTGPFADWAPRAY